MTRWLVLHVMFAGAVSGACGGGRELEGQDTAVVAADVPEIDDVGEDGGGEPEVVDDVAGDVAGDVGPPPECGPGSLSPLPDPCNDYDPCTADTCVEGACVRTTIAECCKSDDVCDDGIACTEDRCNRVRNRCESVRGDSFCCVTAADCDDFDPCTDNVCAANRCVYPVRPSCPVGNPALCNDQNDCTSDRWSSDGRCSYERIGVSKPGCCGVDGDCLVDEGWIGLCQEGRCWSGRSACGVDADCAGPGVCSTGSCRDGQCAFPEAGTCCESDGACDDGLSETVDRCVENRCVYALFERRCSEDAMCNQGGACVVGTCVSGQCSAEPVEAVGCCRDHGDCVAPDRCSRTVCNGFTCEVSAITGASPIWFEAFDSLTGWSVAADNTGAAWRLASSQYISPGTSLYFGTIAGGFDVGTTRGTITGPPIEVPEGLASSALSVRFWRNVLVESISSRDLLELQLVRDGHAPIVLWDKGFGNGPGLAWREDEVPIPAGITGTFRLRFSFDTIDGVDNRGQGVFIDDLRVLAPCD